MSARMTRAMLAMVAAGAPAERAAQTIFNTPLEQAPLSPPIVGALLSGSTGSRHPELAQRIIEALPSKQRMKAGAPMSLLLIATVAGCTHGILKTFVWPVLQKMSADLTQSQVGFNGLLISQLLISLGLLVGVLSLFINRPARRRTFGFLGDALRTLRPPRTLRSVDQTLRWLAAIETAQLSPAPLLESLGGRAPLSHRPLADLFAQMRAHNSAWAAVQAWAKVRSQTLQNLTVGLAPQESSADAIRRVAELYPRSARFEGALEMLGMASLCAGIGMMVIPVYLAIVRMGMAF